MEIRCLPEHKLSEAERSVIEYIRKQQCIINLLTISDIADGAFVSNATVSRAIRKCGFSSLSEMKFRLAEDAKDNKQAYEMNRILSKSYTECLETIKSIDIPTVIEVTELIRNAKTVYLLANGLTALVANEFAVQLQCQKVNVCLISDSEMMRKLDLLCDKDDLVLILSVKNSTPELCIAGGHAKKNGAKVVSCCCKVGTALDEVSDLVIYGHSESIHSNRIFGGTSRIGLMMITRTIIEYMATDIE